MSGTNAYQSPPIAEPGAPLVAGGELDAGDLGQPDREQRALHALDQAMVIRHAPGQRGLGLLAIGDVEHHADGARRGAGVVGEDAAAALVPVDRPVGPLGAMEEDVGSGIGQRPLHAVNALGAVIRVERGQPVLERAPEAPRGHAVHLFEPGVPRGGAAGDVPGPCAEIGGFERRARGVGAPVDRPPRRTPTCPCRRIGQGRHPRGSRPLGHSAVRCTGGVTEAFPPPTVPRAAAQPAALARAGGRTRPAAGRRGAGREGDRGAARRA